jgi:acetyl-CoA/propionyl-CoA carboxylase, biotin carboxylase, biotin carboxyl carrier protein
VIKKILVANRGEIAVRVMRTAREMGIACVAVYSEPDRDALHVRMADEAYFLGPATPSESYLNVDKILEAARRSGAQAVHPGYGFLAENASFARRVCEAALIWVGPHADAIDAMGDKLRARRAMETAGVPFVPGSTQPLADAQAAREAAKRYGLPLAIKASGGGGGKGLKVARTLDEIDSSFATAVREAQAYFANPVVYAERYLENPKHVELQILADKCDTVLHVGERDCSLQRRNQKLWEETPAQISATVRERLREAGVRAARAIAYDSVGTIEFLVAGTSFYFLEMNTRIQVEHTVTEMAYGIDLIREQIRVATGEPLGYGQERLTSRGAAIEVRINAEDPAKNFRPAPGTLAAYRQPSGPGVRVDSAAFAGLTISADYDSLIAKLIVWAATRDETIARLRRAIDEFEIEGVPTTLPILRAICDYAPVRDATYGTSTLERFAQDYVEHEKAANAPAQPLGKAHVLERRDGTVSVEVNDKLYHVRFPEGLAAPSRERRVAPRVARTPETRISLSGDTIRSPMHGTIVEVSVAPGDAVREGQVVAVIEAMKMMNELRSHRDGVVKKLHAAVGSAVESNSPVVEMLPQ